MSLSKIVRHSDSREFRQVEFLDFDDKVPEKGTRPDKAAPFEPENSRDPESRKKVPAPGPDLEELIAKAREEGMQESAREAAERFGKAEQAFGKAIEEISRLRESILRNSSQDMLRLVLTISRQVIQNEIRSNPEVVLSTIRRALEVAVRSDSYRILVHPDDLGRVSENKPLFLASINTLENVEIRGDGEVERGGCRLESEFGQVDATLEGQLEEIRRVLSQAVEED